MNDLMLKAENLSAGYGKKVVVGGVELSAEKGKILTLIGPNGAGKSTVLKTLCRQLEPLGNHFPGCFGGEIETNVTFGADGRITAIAVRDAQETDGIGAVLTADGSEYLAALIAGQDDLSAVESVSGATITSNALKTAVQYALAEMAK